MASGVAPQIRPRSHSRDQSDKSHHKHHICRQCFARNLLNLNNLARDVASHPKNVRNSLQPFASKTSILSNRFVPTHCPQFKGLKEMHTYRPTFRMNRTIVGNLFVPPTPPASSHFAAGIAVFQQDIAILNRIRKPLPRPYPRLMMNTVLSSIRSGSPISFRCSSLRSACSRILLQISFAGSCLCCSTICSNSRLSCSSSPS